MPLDGNESLYVTTDPDAEVRPDLSKPSLEALAYILRHREEWPKGWIWDYSTTARKHECGTAGCAIGFARTIWKDHGIDFRFFGTPRGPFSPCGMEADAIFDNGTRDPLVTPEVVAGRIDDHLAGRPIRYLVAGDRG